MGSPIDMNVGVFWETSVVFLKSAVVQFLTKYGQSYVNLNVKQQLLKNRQFVTYITLQDPSGMALVNFVTFVVLKILAMSFPCKTL